MYALARDKNEREVVQALNDAGCLTLQLNKIDLLVLRGGMVYLLEVKNPDGRDKLTPAQEKMIKDGWPLRVVRSAEEAISAVGL